MHHGRTPRWCQPAAMSQACSDGLDALQGRRGTAVVPPALSIPKDREHFVSPTEIGVANHVFISPG